MENKIVVGFVAQLYPTKDQVVRLNQWSGSLRFLWNRLLDIEKAEYAATGKFIWNKQLQPIAAAMKYQPGLEWLADLPSCAAQDVSSRIDYTLQRMAKERKVGRDYGFPRPKKKFIREVGIYCSNYISKISSREAKLPKLGRVKLRGGDLPNGRLLGVRIRRDGSRWMLSAQFECARPAPMEATGVTVGIDLGVATLVTTFDGSGFDEITAPKHLRKALKRLRRAERTKSRRKKGSTRRRAQIRRVGVIHRKVRERRKDLLHQISHQLTTKADVLKVETLNIRGMLRNHHLALSVTDAGMSRLIRFCEYKADWRGRRIEKIDPWFPGSQTCSCCGEIHREMKNLKERVMHCDCGNVMGRDQNAAVNHYWYSQEGWNRIGNDVTRMETGDQELAPVPVGEVRIDAGKRL
jgi:putative transposase